MTDGLKVRVRTAFGLAFDVEKDTSHKSGFHPARIDLGVGKELFGDLRLLGFAAALTTGFAENLMLMGGDEGRYKGETPTINRAESIREMLLRDMDIEPARVAAFPSRSNTGGNIDIIADHVKASGLTPETCCLITNHYHLPRASNMLADKRLHMRLMSAEALWLVQVGNNRKDVLVHALGEGPLAERDAEEIQGIADMIRGSYQARTDVTSTWSPSAVRSSV